MPAAIALPITERGIQLRIPALFRTGEMSFTPHCGGRQLLLRDGSVVQRLEPLKRANHERSVERTPLNRVAVQRQRQELREFPEKAHVLKRRDLVAVHVQNLQRSELKERRLDCGEVIERNVQVH